MWRNDGKGEVVIDDSDEMATVIPAWRCDDLCLTKGTAETLDDLAVLLGERQYELIEGIAVGLGVQIAGAAADHLRQKGSHALLAFRLEHHTRRQLKGHRQRLGVTDRFGHQPQPIFVLVLANRIHHGAL